MRERVAEVLHRAGALKAVMRLRRVAPLPSAIAIVTYHHIADDDPAYPYDPGVADATPAQFRRQMELLARYGTPIGMSDLVAALDGAPLPRNPVMVTFDDGYRSCHDVALPILRQVGVPAVFFIATSFINDRRLYWWEKIAVALSQARVPSVRLTYPRPLEVDAKDPRALIKLTDLIKDTPSLDVDRFVAELSTALGLEWTRETEARHADNLVMTWDQVRALSAAGMDVESHTKRHRVLQNLDPADLRDELEGSRLELEAQTGRPVRALAYPVGRRIREPWLKAAVASAGYRVGLSNASGSTRFWPGPLRQMRPIDPFDVRRLSTEKLMSDGMWFTQVAIPRLAFISKHNVD